MRQQEKEHRGEHLLSLADLAEKLLQSTIFKLEHLLLQERDTTIVSAEPAWNCHLVHV
jgi:hypothetical protein